MVNTMEKFSNVTFKRPARIGVISALLSGNLDSSLQRFVSAFIFSARITVENKTLIEQRHQHLINCLVDQSFRNRRFVNNSRFWINDMKLLINNVSRFAGAQFLKNSKYVIFKMKFKFLDIRFAAFPLLEFLPC